MRASIRWLGTRSTVEEILERLVLRLHVNWKCQGKNKKNDYNNDNKYN